MWPRFSDYTDLCGRLHCIWWVAEADDIPDFDTLILHTFVGGFMSVGLRSGLARLILRKTTPANRRFIDFQKANG